MALSIIAICRTCCRTIDLGLDYIGIIVGVLAILVTVLVTWNIYSVIDANNKIKDYQREIDILKEINEGNVKKLEKKTNEVQGRLFSTATSIEEKIIDPSKMAIYTDMIFNVILSIDSLSCAESFVFADKKLEQYVIMLKSNYDSFKKNIESDSKKDILELLFGIPNKEKLKNFKEFKEIVVRLCS